jgi:hypothetical protein
MTPRDEFGRVARNIARGIATRADMFWTFDFVPASPDELQK